MDWTSRYEMLRAAGRRFWRGEGARKPWLRRLFAIVFAFLVPLPLLFILIFRLLPVPATPQMLIDLATGNAVRYRWVAYDRISPLLARAVIGSEDQKFCSHSGFDWSSIDQALKAHARGRPLRGASTISQQAARSLFLTPIRSWARKGIEAWLTVLLEGLCPKRRILTVYLNLVDWGHGNFGAEAASEVYFHKSAAMLTAREAARLAAILPDPGAWRAVGPGPYVSSRTDAILSRMAEVARDRLDSCVNP